MSLQAKALARLVPRAEDIHVATVGTSATTAVDLFTTFGITAAQVQRGNYNITIQADGEAGITFGDSSVGAPDLTSTSGATRCKRLPADAEVSFVLTKKRRFYRAIAASAGTRLEIVFG